jgi:hypothetical protein
MEVRPRLPPWRRSADRTCLYENSLVSGNFTGNFAISGLRQLIPEQETAALQHFPEQFPKQINRENISRIREFLRDNRVFRRIVGLRMAVSVHFLHACFLTVRTRSVLADKLSGGGRDFASSQGFMSHAAAPRHIRSLKTTGPGFP